MDIRDHMGGPLLAIYKWSHWAPIYMCVCMAEIYIYIWAPAKTSDRWEQLHQNIDTWYDHETLRNDRGDTKKRWLLIYMFAWFWIWRHSPSHLISAWNQASKSIQTLCAKSKRYHAENEHTLKVRKWKAAQNDDQNDDWRMTIFLVSESLQAHPHRASSKMTSWLVRNYSFFMAAAAFFFCCCLFCCICFCYCFFSITCSFHVHNAKPSGTMGDTQKTMTISAMSFRGCNRFSPSLIYIYIYKMGNWFFVHPSYLCK